MHVDVSPPPVCCALETSDEYPETYPSKAVLQLIISRVIISAFLTDPSSLRVCRFGPLTDSLGRFQEPTTVL